MEDPLQSTSSPALQQEMAEELRAAGCAIPMETLEVGAVTESTFGGGLEVTKNQSKLWVTFFSSLCTSTISLTHPIQGSK